MLHITCHIARVIYQVSHVTYHVTDIKCHMLHIKYHMLHIKCHMSSVTCYISRSFYKFSHVFPLHKKDSRAVAANYRPISLTSHIIKVYERVIRKKLVDYLEMNNLICGKQHGFRSGRSCLTQLLYHFDDILESLTNNSDFDSVYLDYNKVDHKLLIRKLALYGIPPKL